MKLTKSLVALTVGAIAVGQAGCCLCKKKEPVYAPAPVCPAPITTNYCPPGGAAYPYAPAMPAGPTLSAPGY